MMAIIVLLLTLQTCYSQETKIYGLLQNSTGKAIPDEIVILKDTSGRTIKFATSNTEGKYYITLPAGLKRSILFLELNSLGYKKIRKQLFEDLNSYDFVLEETSVELKDVRVKSGPVIRSKGDTLSYDVGSFSWKEDRTIGDVIKHMPGLSVAENGQISYNGKSIAGFYIQGDDLMDGRYGLATKTINKEMIRSVDIMQHFQSINVLKNKVPTDDVVLNLVLKDENKVQIAGQGVAGIGLPQQYDVSANAILFNRKLKILNSIKGNNSGIDYKDEFNQYNYSDFLNSLDNVHNDPLLSDAINDGPDLPRKNYYFNNSGVLNANNLLNTKDSLQIKSNIQLFVDRNTSTFFSQTDNYLLNDTVRYFDRQNVIHKPVKLFTSLTGMLNKNSYFLRDNLRINLGWYNNENNTNFNSNSFSQRLSGREYDVSNDFEWIPTTKQGNVVDVHWYVNFNNNPQNLSIGTGIDSNILNNNIAYSSLFQQASIPSFTSNLSAYYLITGKHLIRQTYQAGVLNEWQQLNSSLTLTQLNGEATLYKGDAGNALQWQRNKAYISATYGIKKNNWEASLLLPLVRQNITFGQNEYNLDNGHSHFFVNPTARFKLFVNTEDYLVGRYTYNWSSGNITDIYRGVILTNYRSLSSNDADLREGSSTEYGFNYYFQRNIIMLFLNMGISYRENHENSIRSNVYTNNIQTTVLLPFPNNQNSLAANVDISKFFFAVNTTATVKLFWKVGKDNFLINNVLLPFKNDVKILNVSLAGKYFSSLTLNYVFNGTWYESKQSGINVAAPVIKNQISRFDQYISLGFSPGSNLFFDIKGRQINNPRPGASTTNYLFLDGNVRYRIPKSHTDIELDITNLLNKTNYQILTLTSNQYSINNYEIRGRMAIFRLTYNF